MPTSRGTYASSTRKSGSDEHHRIPSGSRLDQRKIARNPEGIRAPLIDDSHYHGILTRSLGIYNLAAANVFDGLSVSSGLFRSIIYSSPVSTFIP